MASEGERERTDKVKTEVRVVRGFIVPVLGRFWMRVSLGKTVIVWIERDVLMLGC